MDISEVARRAGVPASTLRFYEERGLITSTGRRGLHRVFEPDILERLALIALGLCNVLLFEWIVRPRVVWLAPGERLPDAARASALASLAAWLAIVICGRSIAYF